MRLIRFPAWLLLALPVIANAQSASFIAVQVEAENFNSKNPDWHVTSAGNQPNVRPDPDPSHHAGASNGTYLELLPDTRVTHGDALRNGVNFWNTAGTGPAISYEVNIPEPGRYLVFVKAYSTGTEDNGIHVGLNDSFPASGNRIQWCNGKNRWTWSSAQRTNSNHCGEERTIYLDIPFAGANTINFTAREDGFEFDQFILLKENGASLRCAPGNNDQISCNQAATDNSGAVVPAPVQNDPVQVDPVQSDEGQDESDQSTAEEETVFLDTPNETSSEETSSEETETAAVPQADDTVENEVITVTTTDTATPEAGIDSTDNTTADASDPLPMCASAESDSDGDGYGWENNRSCLVGDSAPATATTVFNDSTQALPVCSSSDLDSDGDGYGWENNATCLVDLQQEDSSSNSDSIIPICEISGSDTDGDGWGWENNQSCLVQ